MPSWLHEVTRTLLLSSLQMNRRRQCLALPPPPATWPSLWPPFVSPSWRQMAPFITTAPSGPMPSSAWSALPSPCSRCRKRRQRRRPIAAASATARLIRKTTKWINRFRKITKWINRLIGRCNRTDSNVDRGIGHHRTLHLLCFMSFLPICA